MRSAAALGAVALVVPWTVGFASGPAEPEASTVCRIADQRIAEASGLVVLPLADGTDGFVVTNDSGDEARVFLLDSDCRTVGVTTWGPEAVDVEALAPAGEGEVWVGDIGDNRGERDTVTVARVPVGPGEREVAAVTFELAYPGGARDAETLLLVPEGAAEYAGRLVVVSKEVFGGQAYVAPRRLRAGAVNALEPLGEVAGMLTDGVFFPDGQRVLLRGYGSAEVLSWPTLETERTLALPAQQQGEAASLDRGGRLLLTSEGVRAPVLRMDLPEAESTSPAPTAEPTALAAEDPRRSPWPWLAGGLGAALALGVLLLALRPR